MKIFISYGHNDHTQLVDLLFDALIREGHEPWKDDRYEGSSGIAAGRDFTQVIYEAIDRSDFVIAFVTNVTKDKPYCCDERQYAYNRKGSHFIQIRMDYADITLGNARSYIDMSDVIGSNGQINQRLFEEKLKALFAAFRDPASFAEGGFTPWTKFDTHLKVPGALKYHDFIASLDRDDFVGRQWLLEKCKSWAMDSTISRRLFVILGEAGTGKTAFVRRLAADEELVRSVHICVYDRPSTRTAKDTLKDLAYVLAQNNRRYFDFLKMKDFEKIRDMTVDGLFEFLFLEPLKAEEQKYLLVIDGLDELEESTGFKPLMRLFRQYADQLNPNISFLLTGRPDAYITDMLRTVAGGKKLESVTLDKNAGKADLQCFIDRKLNRLGCYSQSLAEQLLEACDGNFEYLTLLFREALEEGLPVFEGMKIPRGLNERYAQYLDRRMEMSDCAKLSREQRRLLSVLCAAYEPLPVSVLSAVTGLEDYDIFEELELFGSLLRRTEGADGDTVICLFTKSFRDFLLGKVFAKYSADHKLGTRLLAQYLTEKCGSEKALEKYPYLDQYGFVHLLQYADEEPEIVTDYINSLANSGADIARRIADALHLGNADALYSYWNIRDTFQKHNEVLRHLRGMRSAQTLDEILSIMEQEGDIAGGLRLKADIALWHPAPEVLLQAEAYYRQVLMIDEQNHSTNPSYESRRDLSVDYTCLGDLAFGKQTPEGDAEAEQWYRKALEMDEQNHRTNSSYECHRDLSADYIRLGDLAYRKQTPEGDAEAEQWYRKALEMDEQNHSANPCYQSRRDLSIDYNRLGDLARRKQTPEGDAEAEQWYRKALEMDEQNHSTNPSYESRRDLSIDYNCLGDLARCKQTPEGDAEAEQWYRKALDMVEQNHRTNPSYESRRDLSIRYNRLGDLAYGKQTPEGDTEAEQWYRKALEMDEQNHSTNPSYESRRDLSVYYNCLGNLALRKQTPEGDAEAERWYRKALTMYEQNHSANPCYQSRRDLSIDYNCLGDLARRKQTPEGDAEAEQWYRKALEMAEQNHSTNPSYESRRDLSIRYNRLGDLALRKQTPEGDAEAEQWYLKMLQMGEQNYRCNPCKQSRNDLAITYGRLALVALQKGTPQGQEEAAQWWRKREALLKET